MYATDYPDGRRLNKYTPGNDTRADICTGKDTVQTRAQTQIQIQNGWRENVHK